MENIYKWYFSNIEVNKLISLIRKFNITIPGFSKDLNKAPFPILRSAAIRYSQSNKARSLAERILGNNKLFKELDGKKINDVREKEQDLLKIFDLTDYVLALAMLINEEDDSELAKYIEELQHRVQNQDNQDESNNIKKKELNEIESLNGKLTRELRNLEKRLHSQEKQLDSYNLQIQKAKNNLAKTEKEYNQRINNLNKSYQKICLELAETKKKLKQVEADNKNVVNELSDNNSRIIELTDKLSEANHLVEEQTFVIKAWKAKYPEGDPFGKVYKVIVIGNKPQREIKFVLGLTVEIKIIDLETAEQMCNQKDSKEKFDLALLIPSRCNYEQRRTIFRDFKDKATKIVDIRNISEIESAIKNGINTVLGNIKSAQEGLSNG